LVFIHIGLFITCSFGCCCFNYLRQKKNHSGLPAMPDDCLAACFNIMLSVLVSIAGGKIFVLFLKLSGLLVPLL
jgi:hypothetical protein